MLRRTATYGAGLVFSYALFTGIGLLQRQAPETPEEGPELISSVSLPPPPPPPPPQTIPEQKQRESVSVDPIGFELARASSAVKIEATPMLVLDPKESVVPPAAFIKTEMTLLSSKPAPRSAVVDVNRIYMGKDVDQRASAIYKRRPNLKRSDLYGVDDPKITLVFVVDKHGKVGNVRVARSTGSEYLDKLIIGAIKQWEFTPAMKGGKPVRQWFEQLINIDASSASPFSTE